VRNKAPRSLLCGIKVKLPRGQHTSALRVFGPRHLAIHPGNKLHGILAKANKALGMVGVLFRPDGRLSGEDSSDVTVPGEIIEHPALIGFVKIERPGKGVFLRLFDIL